MTNLINARILLLIANSTMMTFSRILLIILTNVSSKLHHWPGKGVVLNAVKRIMPLRIMWLSRMIAWDETRSMTKKSQEEEKSLSCDSTTMLDLKWSKWANDAIRRELKSSFHIITFIKDDDNCVEMNEDTRAKITSNNENGSCIATHQKLFFRWCHHV